MQCIQRSLLSTRTSKILLFNVRHAWLTACCSSVILENGLSMSRNLDTYLSPYMFNGSHVRTSIRPVFHLDIWWLLTKTVVLRLYVAVHCFGRTWSYVQRPELPGLATYPEESHCTGVGSQCLPGPPCHFIISAYNIVEYLTPGGTLHELNYFVAHNS